MKKISALTFLFSIAAFATIGQIACYTGATETPRQGRAWSSVELSAKASLTR